MLDTACSGELPAPVARVALFVVVARVYISWSSRLPEPKGMQAPLARLAMACGGLNAASTQVKLTMHHPTRTSLTMP